MAIVFGNIAGQEPSTVTFRVGTVTIARGSTNEQQEILVVGDPQTSNALARVVAAEPASTEFGLITRMAGRVLADQNSTVWATQAAQAGAWTVRSNLSSTSADNPVTASQNGAWTVRATLSSTGTDNPVSAAQAGAWTVRSNLSSTSADNPVNAAQAGSWTVRATLSSTNADNPVRAILSSTSADNPVNAAQAGTWKVGPSDTNFASSAGFHFDSSGALLTTASFTGSTTVNVSSVAGVVAVAPVLGSLQTYAASTTGQSSATTIVSSNATTKGYVYAYSVISTVAGPVQWGIYRGSTLLWAGVLAAVSSAVSGANLAVSPPAYLFAGSTGKPLTFNCVSSNAGLTVSLGYWVA